VHPERPHPRRRYTSCVSSTNIARTLTAATHELGYCHWHPHELGHIAASLMSAAGIPIETIADQLGNDGTRITLLVYRHTTRPTISAGNAMTQHLTE